MSITTYFQSLEHKKSRGLLFFLVILSTFIYLRFDKIIHDLETPKVVEAWGDGFKTYGNTMYHIDYDAENHWFGGMNYPYGEHIVPATELPGIAMVLKSLKFVFPNISKSILAIIHLEMLLAFLLCGVFLFLLFRELNLPFWYSGLVSIGLTFLNPQMPRMLAHFGLAQPFVLPMLLYLLLLFEKKQSLLVGLGIGVGIFIASFLHFYFFGISVFFVSFYCLFRLLQQRIKKTSSATPFLQKITQSAPFKYATKMVFPYFLMVGLPLAFFYFWMIGPDPVLDRTPTPYGLLVYISNSEGIFLSKINPISEWFMTYIITPRPTQYEGIAYIGMVAVLFVLFRLFWWIGSGFRHSFLPVSPDTFRPFLQAAFGTGLVLLLLSMGLPFIIPPLEFLKEYIGLLKQFRSLGRFAWAFYFVINMLAFYFLYFWLKEQRRNWRMVGFVAGLSLLFFEAYQFTYQSTFALSLPTHWETNNTFNDLAERTETLDFSQYQATIPIPYFSIGSNNFNFPTGGFVKQRVQTIALQTGVPTTGAMLTRSSRRQTFNQFQLIMEPYRLPAIFSDLKSKKPFLLAWRNSPNTDYSALYGHLKDGATSVFKEGEFELWHTELQDFRNRIIDKKKAIQEAIKKDSLFQIEGLLATDSIQRFVFKNFDERNSTKTYLGNGAFAGQLNQSNQLFFDTLPNVLPNVPYHLQTWVWVDEDKFAGTLISFTEEDATGAILQEKKFHVWPNARTLDPNGWLLMEQFFQPTAKDSRFRWTFKSLENDARMQYFDELLIKPVSTNLYQKTDAYIWKNNLWFKP